MEKYTIIELKVPTEAVQEITSLVHNYVTDNYLPNRIKVVPVEKEQEYKDEVDEYLVENGKEAKYTKVVDEPVIDELVV